MKKKIISLFFLSGIIWYIVGESFTVMPKKKKMSYQKLQECFGEILEDIAHMKSKVIECNARATSKIMTIERQLLENNKESAFARATPDEREVMVEKARKHREELSQWVQRSHDFEISI
ncbi:MAG: hypothetical protein WC707_01865 [Candidatus Babeliaceae bacterium]|jgi:hypothetical protein